MRHLAVVTRNGNAVTLHGFLHLEVAVAPPSARSRLVSLIRTFREEAACCQHLKEKQHADNMLLVLAAVGGIAVA